MNAMTPSTTVLYEELNAIEEFVWIEFSPGVHIMKIPVKIPGFSMLKCKLKKGSIVPRHDHDFFEAWTLISGLMKDGVSGVMITPERPIYSCHVGTPHQPEALEDSLLYIFCKK